MNLVHQLAFFIVAASSLYHLVMGSLCLLNRRLVGRLAKFFYKFEMPEKSHAGFEYAMKPLGLFAIFTGLVCAIAVVNPGPWVIGLKVSLAVLFVGRALVREIYKDLLYEAFAITSDRSRWNIYLNMVLSAILLISAFTSGPQ